MGKNTRFSFRNSLLLFLASLFLLLLIPQKIYSDSENTKKGVLAMAQANYEANDTRVRILQSYLSKYNSPLIPYAYDLVHEADKNNIDWKLLAAISGVESTFANEIPVNSYNAWGWGIFGDQTKRFNSWDEAIKTISKSLREDYMNKWKARDVYQIGRIYAASPTWAERVESFMERIDENKIKDPKNTLSLSL